MKIKIYLSQNLMKMEEDLEISVLVVGDDSELNIAAKEFEFEDDDIPISIKAVIEALDLIFNDEGYEQYRYVDIDGEVYTHPGDVKEVINNEEKLPEKVSSAKIGRFMLHTLGMAARSRKSDGIPYFLKDNENSIRYWKEKITEAENQENQIPAEALAAAEMRLSQLDALEESCNWSSPCPTTEERKAREDWQRIMDAQSEFESKYC